MHKFHQIPTDKFVPVSHDNSYLFTHYDKVANFLAFNLKKNYKNILAKPLQNGYSFDWFSVYEGLVNINESRQAETNAGLIKYWEFIDVIKAKIAVLSNSYDDDSKNWANLLSKVFNHQDNFIFSNGKDISIVWGWKFDNKEIYKPNLLDKSRSEFLNETKTEPVPILSELEVPKVEEVNPPIEEVNPPLEKVKFDEELPKKLPEEPQKDEEEPLKQDYPESKYGFMEFLKWFAAKFWWLLWLLTFLVALVFIVKAYNIYS